VLAKLDVLVASERVSNDVLRTSGLSLPTPLESIGFLPAVYLSPTTWVAHLDAPRFEGWRTYIFCCGPETTLPTHGHGGDELIVVVEGAFHDERDFGAGDFAENKPGMVHEMQSSPGGRLIALVSSAGPIEWRAEDRHLGELLDI
jgi:putative transcriptional regulator